MNGCPRDNGATQRLVDAFAEGARGAGNEVTEVRLAGLEIAQCRNCGFCAGGDPASPCVQVDGMARVYAEFASCDVVAFASPLYFWTVTGCLKTAVDRLYAELRCLGYAGFERECALLMTAGGSDYSQAVRWYRTFERNLGWTNLGEVLGAGREGKARSLGARIG